MSYIYIYISTVGDVQCHIPTTQKGADLAKFHETPACHSQGGTSPETPEKVGCQSPLNVCSLETSHVHVYFNFQHVQRRFNFCKNNVRRCARVKSWGLPVGPRSTMKWAWFASLLCRSRNARTPVSHGKVCRCVSSSNFSDPPKSAIFIGKLMLDHWRLGCTLRLNNTPYVSGKLGFSGVA